jgi:CelD/BcsL family acetyltransferase involved in cellulose biosynthesis
MLGAVDIELVTDVARLDDFVDGWEGLVDEVAEPRAGGAIVAAWARHMMRPDVELRVWVATEGAKVVGVLPLVAEPMGRGRERLFPATTDLMFGTVPIASPACAGEVADAVAADFAGRAASINVVSVFWLPQSSPWATALGSTLVQPDWVAMNPTLYGSTVTFIAKGLDAWLDGRTREFRREYRRRARRCDDEGFRLFTAEDPAEIMARLPSLRALYQGRLAARGGAGYRFDDDMVTAIGAALDESRPGRFALSVLERDNQVIGATLARRAGARVTCWIVGHDHEWSRLGPGLATLLEALDAGARAGCEIGDLGVGDQPYKEAFEDGSFRLESVSWCRPRSARLLEFGVTPV